MDDMDEMDAMDRPGGADWAGMGVMDKMDAMDEMDRPGRAAGRLICPYRPLGPYRPYYVVTGREIFPKTRKALPDSLISDSFLGLGQRLIRASRFWAEERSGCGSEKTSATGRR